MTTMDEARMRADLEARLERLRALRAESAALFNAGLALGRLEGAEVTLAEVLAGLGEPATPGPPAGDGGAA